MKLKLSLALLLAFAPLCLAQKVNYTLDPATGGISRLWIDGERSSMNWICDNCRWGLGFCGNSQWNTPAAISEDGSRITYNLGDVILSVDRRHNGKDLLEKYSFTNISGSELQLDSIGIYTPFNDNYPNTETCLSSRCHAHVWTAGNASYVNLFQMGAKAPHLGLAVVKGRIDRYEIWGRDRKTTFSNSRGLFSLSPEPLCLAPGQSYVIEWRLFANSGWEDFFSKLIKIGSVRVKLNKYSFQQGEKAVIEVFGPENKLKNCCISVEGQELPARGKNGHRTAEMTMDHPGELRIDIAYGNGEITCADCQVRSGFDKILENRVHFIIDHQQMNDPADPRYGAYLIYDNESEAMYLNNTPNVSPGDRCEGAERVGMGVMIAKHCLLHPDSKVLKSLERYVDFVRRGLQDTDYNTWRSMSHAWGYRVYNYPWIAELYFLMYKLTGNKQYVLDGYGTLKAMYREYGHKRYPIGVPVTLSLNCLSDAGFNAEHDSLLEDYRAVGEAYLEIGLKFPKHEVNYEQSIVAPSVVFLTEMYLLTGEAGYLEEAGRQMPVLEAFGGLQPSFHLNEIAIRHWDGYWFGKREMWGDTMPHYWSCITAQAYHNYALCTGNPDYQRRAETIVDNNLCLFTEDGRGSCAYIYPARVNGRKAEFYDPYANDQDWALSYYLDIKTEK